MSKGRAMRVLAMSGMGGEGEKGRYRENGREAERYDSGRYRGDRMHDEGGRRAEWPEMGRGRRGRYMGVMNGGDEYDEDDYEGGRGGYAGRFRHSKNSGEHEAGEDEVGLDEHRIKKWVAGMHNSDGTTGEHFKVEQTEPMRNAHCPQCDKHEFWATMNMMYSDYCEVAKKMNIDRPEFYAHMAKAFLMDKDAGENKLEEYVKHVAGR